jgi:hypothetical protein
VTATARQRRAPPAQQSRLSRAVTSRVPALLRDRPFRRYWSAQTISMSGDQISSVAMPLAAVLVLHAKAAQMVLDISIGSIFAAVIPDHLRARVTGAFQAVNYGTRPAGALAAGGLGTLIGLRPTLWLAAGGATLGFLWLLPSPLSRFRMPSQASPTRQER